MTQRRRGMTLGGRLLTATLAVLALTLALTVGLEAFLTRQQVGRSQAAALARQADSFAAERRSSPSYINSNTESGGIRTIVASRRALVPYVADPGRSSNGETTYEGGRYLYSYRTIPARGLLLLRPVSARSAAWRPFLRDLLLAALAGAALAALLSLGVARSIVRPIRRVAEASRALAAGEKPTPLPEDGARELASLAGAFNAMAAQLEASRESERAFLLSVSHELKTPLTAIRGYAEGLAEGAFDANDAAETILLESRRLERLVYDLLDLARMNRHEFSVRCEPVDLGLVVREVTGRHDGAARGFGVELVADPVEAWVEADHDRVLQVASNLVENALRETPRGGRVVVSSAAPGALHVSDTGPGLDAADLGRAFDRFFLYDKYGRERPVGSGLGLAIVKQLAVAMGGAVSVEASPGAGARFTVELPPGLPPPALTASRAQPGRVDDLQVGAGHATEAV